MGYVHVKDKATGHEYAIPERLFNEDAHKETGKSALDAHGDLVAPKFRTTVSKAAAAKSAKSAATSGQQAETDKE